MKNYTNGGPCGVQGEGVHFLGMRNGVPSSILQLNIKQFKWRFSNER